MGELASALDGLAADDLDPLTDARLLDRVTELVAAQNRIAAELARTVRRAELAQAPERDGKKTAQSWLRGHVRLSPAAAAQLVRTGRALERLPAVAFAFAAGHVTAEQVAVIAKVTEPERLAAAAEQGVDLAEVDQALAEVAATHQHTVTVRVVGHYLARLDPDGPEPDPTEQRKLSLAKLLDGRVTGRFELDALGGEKLQAALEALLAADRPAGDTRTRAQRLADALVQLADNALAQGNLPFHRGVKPHVFITIDRDDVTDPATGPATASTGYGADLSAAKARQAACDATITRVELDPDGLPLNVGRSQRIVPPHIRRAVELRDKKCVFTGCDAPTHWCEVHHLVEWIFGGETSLDNSALLCERHHTKVHHGFRVERQPDGRWRTWRPDGTEIIISPLVLN